MKKFAILLLLLVFIPEINAQVYEFNTVTVIESIIPNGLGRSRMISVNDERDYKEIGRAHV